MARLPATLGPPPRAPIQRALGRLWQPLDALPLPRRAAARGLRRLERQRPDEPPACLVHRDLRSGNDLVHEGRLTATLDWEFAGRGHPPEDLGWFSAPCWRFASPQRGGGGVGAIDGLLAACNAAAGTRGVEPDLHHWQLLAHVRRALVAKEQAERHCAGAEPSLGLALTGRLVAGLEAWILQRTRPPQSALRDAVPTDDTPAEAPWAARRHDVEARLRVDKGGAAGAGS